MGMYDTLIVKCPKCGTKHEFQSKAGPCELNEWTLKTLPTDLFYGFEWVDETCACGQRIRLELRPTKFKVVISEDDNYDGEEE